MNHKCRALELYALRWKFDISGIDARTYEKMDDAIVDEVEETSGQKTKSGKRESVNKGSDI